MKMERKKRKFAGPIKLLKMMDALSVVSQLRDLASEPQNREVIVQDQGCLPGLVLFLDHQNPDVLLQLCRERPVKVKAFMIGYRVKAGLEPIPAVIRLKTLRYLAELSANIPTMKNELGMMVSLENLMARDGLSVDITSLAKEVYDILNAPANPPPERKKKPQFFLNSSNKKAKSITLHIQGLDSSHRGLCEEALLKVKGVISFTFQMASKRCTVRIRSDLPTESLATAIADTKVLSAQQVIKNEAGEEVYIPLKSSGVDVPQNSALPDYLPEEEESPVREVDRAISRTTAKEDSSGSWLNAAASFLTKTFYW